MPAPFDTSQFDLPAGALIGAAAFGSNAGTRYALVEQLRDRIDQGRTEQNKWRGRFRELYEQAQQSNWDTTFLIRWAAALLEKQRAALELFHPIIEGLQQRATDYATRPDADLMELCLATIDLVLGWITPYQILCGQILELAAQRRRADTVLRARPVEGEIDHAALSREFMERFPKIRAALAK